MEQYLSLFADVRPWHWWALAAVLIAVEIMSTTFYFLWPGVAAGLVGMLLLFVPSLGVNAQILLFGVLAVVSTIAWKRYAPADLSSAEPHPTLNRRAAQYEGRRARVAANFSGGRGAILLDDTRWSAMTEDGSDPAVGETVTVTGADGSVLTVKAA
jgi:hypothetical protein